MIPTLPTSGSIVVPVKSPSEINLETVKLNSQKQIVQLQTKLKNLF